MTRGYHNLTAHYNVYFNGNEAMKMGIQKIDKEVQEDYTKILPVFKESLPKTEEKVSGDMTTAIEKGTKLIKFHSITTPPKKSKSKSKKKTAPKSEYNNWVDDAYMMIGKGYYYKKDFVMASSTFQQIIRKYKNEPEKYNAYLWLIRCYSEMERYTEAQQVIETLDGDNMFPEKLDGELAIVAADMHLKQQHFDEAIHYLNIGIKNIKGNKRKTRYTFILAQLYQETKKPELALEAYKQVIRRRPEYEMLFNARINSAGVFSGEQSATKLRKDLKRMLKKRWNEPYYDQIYFALAKISHNEGKIDEAIELYKKSVALSTENTHQRALGCLTLANVLFDQKKYIPAGNYYDSAMVVIDESYPNFEAISKEYNNLNKLVTSLVEVEKQDSLQKLAGLSDKELNEKIQGWIDAEKKKQEALLSSENSGGDAGSYYAATSSRMRLSNTGSSFYFYNTSTISYGKKEFEKLFGKRKLEDNWRRTNKSEISLDEQGEPIAEKLDSVMEEEVAKRFDDPTTKDYYLQDIPRTDSLMKASHNKIRDALFTSATLLKTDFNDFEYSVKNFTGLNNRYPENIYLLTSYFNLWDLHKTIGNIDSSNYYRDLILQKFPESNYAKYLNNPNFLVEEAARKENMNNLYNQAFNSYKKRDFASAAQYSSQVMSMNPDTSLAAKTQFINTVSKSRNLGNNEFASALKSYISQYPKSEPTELAQKILALIKEDKLSDYNQLVSAGYLNDVIKNSELLPQNMLANDSIDSKWNKDSDLLHYFIIAYPNDATIDINRLKFDIANYNLDNFTSFDFEIETENLNQETKLLIVRNFENKESALVYFLSIIRKPEVFKTLAGKSYLNFVASSNNYREMLSQKTYNEYLAFFVKNYSSITTGKFSEKELESPEALIAKLKQDSTEELTEQGEYVVVDTKDADYKPVVKEQLFTLDYNAPHSYTIMIPQKNIATGYLMRDFVRYNSASHKEKRLKVIPGRLKEATLLSISSFANANEALDYLKQASVKSELFASLKNAVYESFVISDENLKKLTETDSIGEWRKFYEANYIRRKPPVKVKPEPAKEEKTERAESSQIGKTTEQPQPKKPEPVQTENKAIQNTKPEPTTVATAPVSEETKKAEVPIAETQNNTADTVAKEIPETSKIEVKSEQKIKEAPVEPVFKLFTSDSTANHNFIFILPAGGSNQALLMTYLTRFNTMKYRAQNLQIVQEPFEKMGTMIIVKGIGNKASGKSYEESVKADQRISMSLRNIDYKSYLISDENLLKLKETKEIAEYQKFYEAAY